ncbi:PHT4C [Auxenochlorella protothecoides x Auxenochlorella symbiontica]
MHLCSPTVGTSAARPCPHASASACSAHGRATRFKSALGLTHRCALPRGASPFQASQAPPRHPGMVMATPPEPGPGMAPPLNPGTDPGPAQDHTPLPSADLAPVSLWKIAAPLALALAVCNMDRICLSVAMVPLAAELQWAPARQGLVQSAFLWGYMATQLLGGWAADKYGGKTVLGWGIAWFSLSSLLLPLLAVTPLTRSLGLVLPAVLLTRFLVGLGEGVAMPAMISLVAQRVSPARSSAALGAAYTGFHSGNLLGLVLSPWLIARGGWRAPFLAFGAAGLPLLAAWAIVVPGRAGGGAQRARRGAGAVRGHRLADLLGNSSVWAIIVATVVNHWGYFIYLNWMPTYFYRTLGLDLRSSSLLSMLPWAAMAGGASLAGGLAEMLLARGWPRRRMRCGIQSLAFLGPLVALAVLAGGGSRLSIPVAVGAMTAALGITSLGQAGFVGAVGDVAPAAAGKLFGLCNTFGTLAGVAGVQVAGIVAEKTGSFTLVFQITGALYVLGTLVFNTWLNPEPQFA